MNEEIKIDYLANHLEYSSVIGEWYYNEWQRYYAAETKDNIIDGVKKRANTQYLPLTLVAIYNDKLVGTVCLKHDDLSLREDLSPWLAGVYVDENFRSRGIGKMLVERALNESKRFGYRTIYLWTPAARAYYESMGWEWMEEVFYLTDKVQIMKYTFRYD